MATTVSLPAHAASAPKKYESGLWSWLATTDHKRIGTLYLYTSLTWFLVGGIEALIIRTQLYGPNGRIVSAQTYNELFTMHGTT
ncbi:MAG: cbb3-type cytochrome c oxidase subunit I, partial [Gemmatimonadaceae bacterium]